MEVIKYRSFLPPGLSVFNGQKYVIPGWYPVPMETTLEEVYTHWKWKGEEKEKKPGKIERDVVSSNGEKTYKVLYNNGVWWCSCIGYEFRRNCSHITKVKEEINFT